MTEHKPLTAEEITETAVGQWTYRVDGPHREEINTFVHRLAEDLRAARAAREAAERERDEARKYGAPVAGAKALGFVKRTCNHDEYWTTSSGACMACRAVKAEAECESLRAVVERRERATEALIQAAIVTADFIEGEYADGNDDGDIIPVSSPAHGIHERLWGAIFKADLPDGASVVNARAAAEAARLAGKGGSENV